MDYDVVIVGGGLAGLACARQLHKQGRSYIVLEASPDIGGRIQTDLVDGFRLDRGFQVLQTGYPEAAAVLDYTDLNLQNFPAGVAVRRDGRFHILADPRRQPRHIFSTLRAPIGTIGDRLAMLRLARHVCRGSFSDVFNQEEESTIEFLNRWGFSQRFIESFFVPFFAGASLDRTLCASSLILQYIFRVFASGNAALPALGMGMIPAQLHSGLAVGQVRVNSRVVAVDDGVVTLADGSRYSGRQVVLATALPALEHLLELPRSRHSVGETCIYFMSNWKPPCEHPFLILNGDKSGPINNLAFPSIVAPQYAPVGKTLIAAVVLGRENMRARDLESQVRRQCEEWFGVQASHWQHLRTYHIEHALPDQSMPTANPYTLPAPFDARTRICGEYQSLPSIQWALMSGRKTAEVIDGELGE